MFSAHKLVLKIYLHRQNSCPIRYDQVANQDIPKVSQGHRLFPWLLARKIIYFDLKNKTKIDYI